MNLIGFDFDATLVQTDLILCKILSEKVGRLVLPEEITVYDLQACLPELSDVDVIDVVNDLVSIDRTFQMPPYPSAMDFLKWCGRYNKIYVITNRPDLEPVHIYLQHNLDKATFDQVELHYTKEKGAVAKALGIKYFIEDKVENIVSLASYGIIPIVFEQLWNKNIISQRSNLSDLCIFVKNWDDIYHVIGCEFFNY